VQRLLVVGIVGGALALPGPVWAGLSDFGRPWPGAAAGADRAGGAYRSHEGTERVLGQGQTPQAEDRRAIEHDERRARALEDAAREAGRPQACTWVREPMTGRTFWICN
jgi:hypothetical protein